MPVPRIFEKLFMWSLLAVLICVVSFAIIRYLALPPSPQDQVPRQEAKYRSVNDAKFRLLFDAGSKALKEARYTEALDDFQEAERSTDQLTAEQYASLKSSRLQVASLSEAPGSNTEAENAYEALAASANQQGRVLSRAKHCEAAVGEFLEAGGRWGVIRLSSGQSDIAALALQIASAANREDAIDLWRRRLNGAR